MSDTTHLIFISYSRKDYYFAESLAFHLLKRGFPAWLDAKDLNPGVEWESDLTKALDASTCVLLVGSPESFKSSHVRGEWERAATQGKRIIFIWFRGRLLPGASEAAEFVDFRGNFRRAMRRLTAKLSSAPRTHIASKARSFGFPWLPPWVLVTAATLTLPFVGAMIFGVSREDVEAGEIPFPVMVAALGVGLFFLARFFSLDFVKRRMGMTRLAICLAILPGMYAFQLLLVFNVISGTTQGSNTAGTEVISEYWQIWSILGAIPLLGLAVLLLVRPEDLLRWSPTGKCWKWYRAGRVMRVSTSVPDAESAFKQVHRFRLVHDAQDKPAADRLRQTLVSLSAEEVPDADDQATAVLLLTNTTRIHWLDDQAERLTGRLLTVVGSGIGLPERLNWLWRRQWIDFRRWELRQRERQQNLPGVPEAVTHPRPPKPVSRIHHLVCAFGALLFVLGGAIQPPEAARSEVLSAQEGVSFITMVSGFLFALPARGLIRRTISLSSFRLWTGPLTVAALAPAATSLYYFATIQRDAVRLILPLSMLILGPLVFSKLRHAIHFWFPLAKTSFDTTSDRLAPNRDWRTFFLFTFYLFLWMILLGVETS